MKPEKTQSLLIQKSVNNRLLPAEDLLAIEEPLEISLKYRSGNGSIEKTISITMRTPGNDAELAAGFLFTEGIIQQVKDIANLMQKGPNGICAELTESANTDLSRIERHFYTSSSCGVCGKSSIDSLRTVSGKPPFTEGFVFEAKHLFTLNESVREKQKVFRSTGGLHASALFDSAGRMHGLFEDIGRHNALDKLIGHTLMESNEDIRNRILFLSGRACYELIQKAVMAGIPVVCALGAPSSLAVELALEFNVTLIGFLKPDGFNVYSGAHRLQGY